MAATEITLRRAFNACLATAVFGAAFFIVFGDVLLRLVLKPDFVGPAHDLIPIFAVAFAFMTMRNFYFAQVIYFTHASYLDLMVSLLFVAVSTVLSLLLVPAYGPHGAKLVYVAESSNYLRGKLFLTSDVIEFLPAAGDISGAGTAAVPRRWSL